MCKVSFFDEFISLMKESFKSNLPENLEEINNRIVMVVTTEDNKLHYFYGDNPCFI